MLVGDTDDTLVPELTDAFLRRLQQIADDCAAPKTGFQRGSDEFPRGRAIAGEERADKAVNAPDPPSSLRRRDRHDGALTSITDDPRLARVEGKGGTLTEGQSRLRWMTLASRQCPGLDQMSGSRVVGRHSDGGTVRLEELLEAPQCLAGRGIPPCPDRTSACGHEPSSGGMSK